MSPSTLLLPTCPGQSAGDMGVSLFTLPFQLHIKRSPDPTGHNSGVTRRLVVCPLAMSKTAGDRGTDSR